MRDIDYFTEARMNKTTGNFLKNLPNELLSRVREKIYFVDHDDVLQGYRGPSDFRNGGSGDSETLRSESGVQEIRVQYNISKHVNWFPVFGNITYGIHKGLNHAYGLSDWKSFYFDEADGSYLSYDEAIERKQKNKNKNLAKTLHQEGIKLLDEGWNAEEKKDFRKAKTFFQTACNKFKEAKKLDPHSSIHQLYEQISSLKIEGDRLFNEGVECQGRANQLNQQHFEKAIDKYKEALLKYQQGFRASKYDKRFKSCIDNVQKSIELATELNNDLIVQRLNEEKAKQAKSLHQEGIKLLDDGWNAEDNNDFKEAETSFQKARDRFKEANNLDPDNTKHQNWEQISVLKIEGDRLFNQGVEFQDQANQLNQQHFEKAIDKYRKALLKYQQGFGASGCDKRFKSCIDRVQKSIKIATEMNDSLIAQRLKEKKVNQARSLHQEGIKLLDEGWNAENNNDFRKAKTIFLTACNKFKEAKKLDPDSSIHQLYEQISSLKIEGDRLFNQSVKLLEQADELDQQNFEKAIDKYKEALLKYQQGFGASGCDKRFKSCIDRVQKSIKIATEMNNDLITQILKDKKVNQAKSLHQEGLKLLDKGWNAENNNDFEEAEITFQTACDTFKEAKNLDPNNTLHQDYEQIISHKIEGDRLFNQSVKLLEQADELDQQNFEKAIEKYKEALLKYQQGFEASGCDKRFKSCIDRVQKSIELATEMNNDLITQKILKDKKVNQARSLHQEGLKLLDKGWNAENNNDFEEAETSFQTACDKFKEAKNLDPDNTLHQDYEQISVFKIEGDRLFNQGVEFQDQANESNQQHFEKAIEKYKEALLKYQQGFEASKYDKRFKSCIDRVQKSIKIVTDTIKSFQSSFEEAINEDAEEHNDFVVEKFSF